MSIEGSERLKSGAEIQVEEEELQNSRNRIRKVKESFGEQQHQAVTTLKCVRTRHVEEVHGKDIRNSDRNSEELNSHKQKQSQHQKSVDQTLNAKMMDENNEFFFFNTTLSSMNAGQPLQQEQICNMRGWPWR